ncbi:MAG: thioredoxin [Confluentimicrobium sp.]|uniref:thioredoxin family protein n=1 Tax=Actibacterium sp. TaxID=1872125 RepID=UPI000C6553C8|nr:thioredoxin family protein [Actibacterium sp.]MBC57967.1 thioredoxin [Actibacterium sp.]
MLSRRVMLGAVAALAAPRLSVAAARMGDDGLHKQDWFLDSFLELGDDLEMAAGQGRGLMVLVEQAGCPYCRELHLVNFERAAIVEYITAHFDVVQLDLWGARAVLDFDGEELEERRLAAKWGVNFTPTTLLFPAANAGATRAAQAEAFRLPGYLKPFHYLSSLEYVARGEYLKQPFQRYLQDRFEALRAQGIEPDVW